MNTALTEFESPEMTYFRQKRKELEDLIKMIPSLSEADFEAHYAMWGIEHHHTPYLSRKVFLDYAMKVLNREWQKWHPEAMAPRISSRLRS